MIQIKDNLIWFIHEFKEGEPKRPSFSAELLSAYVCPVCRNILKAFFKGNFSYNLSEYKPYGINYRFGYVPGGTYMEIEEHSCYTISESVRECEGWEVVRRCRGIANCLEVLSNELGKHAKPSDFFISKLMRGEVECLRVVHDITGNDEPILMYNSDKIIGVSSDDDVDTWYERSQRIGEIFAELITEQREIKVESYTKPKSIETLEEQVIVRRARARRKGIRIQRGQVSLLSF